MPKGTGKVLAQNRQAHFEYTILDTFEAGIVLKGTEIKSIRNGKLNLRDGYVSIHGGEAILQNVHISPFEQGNIFNHDPLRTRKLLLHKKQINYLANELKMQGVTIIPLKVYLKDGFAKVLIGIAQGKKKYDKRESLKQKDMKREIDRAMKNR